MNPTKLEEAKAYSLTRNGAGFITRNGYLVASWGKPTDRYPLFSVTKSVGVLLLGRLAPLHGITLDAKAQAIYPDFGALPVENQATGFLDDVTIEQLATHSAGFEKLAGAPRLKFQPGTQWVYSDGGANWLADILTFKANEDLKTLLERDFLTPLNIRPVVAGNGQFDWRNVSATNPRGTTIGAIPRREFNAGISATVDAMARLGLLVERKGTWNGVEIVPAAFIQQMVAPAASIAGLPITTTGGAPDPAYPNATAHLGLFWWNNADGALPNVPPDAHWAWGLGDHLIVVIPSLGIVVSRTSGQATEGDLRLQPNPWKNNDPNNRQCVTSMCAHYDVLDPFLTPIVQSVETALPGNGRPVVNAGADATITLPTLEITLTGTASDDGQPAGSTLATQWSVVGGAGVTIATPAALTTVVTFTAPGTYTLRLNATDSNLSASDDVVITVAGNAPPTAPVVTLTSNPTTVTTGGTATLNWSATNADACTASSGWTGARPVSGTETVTVAQTTTYTLACTGVGGSTESSVTVTANAPAPAPEPPPEDSGGGGGMFEWWTLLALAALGGLRRAFVPGRRRGPIPV